MTRSAIGKDVFIGPNVVIGKCEIGDNVVIHGNAYIYDNSINSGKGNLTKIFLYSDTRGDYSLTADHFAPLASGANTLNAFDWNGFWKWSVALIDCVYHNINCDYISDSDNCYDLGSWSDGEPVKKPKVEIK